MEENVKLKKSNNRMKAIIVILSFILVLAGILIFVFCCGKKEEVKPADNKQEEKKEENKPVQRKKVEVGCGNDSNVTFNGYNIKITAKRDADCETELLEINGANLTNELASFGSIIQYEIFDDTLVYEAGTSGGSILVVYNMKTGEKKEYTNEEMEYFGVRTWVSDDKGITIEGINNKAMYGVTNNHNNEKAEFRMDYENGKFTAPKFVKDYGAPIN